MITKEALQAHADEMAAQEWWPLVEAELADPRYVSKLGDRRERAVACRICTTPTKAFDMLCDRCYEALQ